MCLILSWWRSSSYHLQLKAQCFPLRQVRSTAPKRLCYVLCFIFQRTLQLLSSGLKPPYFESGISEFPACPRLRGSRSAAATDLKEALLGKDQEMSSGCLICWYTCVTSTSSIKSSEAQAKGPSSTNTSSYFFSQVLPWVLHYLERTTPFRSVHHDPLLLPCLRMVLARQDPLARYQGYAIL